MFILVDRKRHPQKPVEPGQPLLESANESLTQVEHQIWFAAQRFLVVFTAVDYSNPRILCRCCMVDTICCAMEALIFFVLLVGFVFAIDSFIYYLNQLRHTRRA